MVDKKEVPKKSLFTSLYEKVSNLFIAERRLSDKDSIKYDRTTPSNWFNRLPIIPQEETPPASGFGYAQSPYISQWTKLWGVNPLTDLPKYRMMYRTVPIVKKAIDKTVATAISKGFELDLPPSTDKREEILTFLKSWIDQQLDFKLHLQMLASDALTYGNAFAEIVYNERNTSEESSDDPEFNRVEIPDPHEDYKIGEHGIPYLPTVNYHGNGKYLDVKAKGDPVWIKPLDPLWMRVRRDSYGNVYGYLQYLSTPPVAFTNDKIIHMRFNPKSWWTENAYGCIWENELVYSSNGLKKVRDVLEGDKIYTFLNNRVEETVVEKLIDNGIQDSYELQTKHRSLIATNIHPFLMEDGSWKQLKDIRVGDKITTIRNSGNSQKEIELIIPTIESRRSENLKNNITLPNHGTKELARLWGFMLGDGWLDSRGNDRKIRFAKSLYEEQNKKYVDLIKNIFNLDMIIYGSVNHQYIGTSKEVCEFFITNGWVSGALYKVIPSWIFKSSDEIKLEFIEGFIDADGYRYKDGNRVDIEIVNQQLLKDIKLLVDSVGFKSGQVRLKSRKVTDKYINGRKIKSILPTFIFTFSYKKFKESDFIIETVKSIEYAGKRHVYDIAVVGDSHNFIVNGVVAHNTSNLMALIRTQEAIWTIENDLILISHACAKPPLIFSCGAVEGGPMDEPWTEGQLTQFVSETSGRGPGGDIYHRGDVQSKPLPFPASSLAPLITHLDYHVQQRMIILGVPPDLLGISGGSNRSTAMVTMDDWINTIQLLQQQMADAMEEQLFRPIIEKAFGEGTPIPNMVWNQVYEKDAQTEIQQVMVLRTSNIITTNEARAMLGDIGKKLEPVTNGDSLLPPMAFMPPEGEQEENEKMPPEDSVLEDEVEAKASVQTLFKDAQKLKPSKKSPIRKKIEKDISKISDVILKPKPEKIVQKIFGGEEEYMNVKTKAPSLTEPKEEEPPALASVQGYAEPGTPSGTGQSQKPDRELHTLDNKGKRFIKTVAHELYGPETIGQSNPNLRSESGNLSGQSNDEADYPNKDLRGIKIKKLKDINDVEVWLIDSKLAASRYDPKWDGGDNKWIGSHHFVMEYVPLMEVWVSDQVPKAEQGKVILHEYVERGLMEQGYTYAEAHSEALKSEGLPEDEVKKRSYITPEEIKSQLNKQYPTLKEEENSWKVGDKEIIFNPQAGIIYVKQGEKIIDQLLVRSSEDIEKFVTKYKKE